jgi:hypothetical protein
MAGLLFVSQAMLDTWAGQGKIDFQGNVMTALAGGGQGRRYVLEPAVRFLRVIGADADPHGLVARVKPMQALRERGAEAMGDSVVLGDVAYEVQPGFLADASALEAAQAAPPSQSPPSPASVVATGRGASQSHFSQPLAPPPAVAMEEKRKEAEALARFLLENLS